MLKTQIFAKLTFCSILLTSNYAFSLQDKEELEMGMSYAHVTQLWGAPQEKIEMEAKHEDLWVYKKVKLRFKNGKLFTIKDIKTANSVMAVDKIEVKADLPKVELKEESKEADVSSETVEDILTEIMKGGDSEPEAATSKRDKLKARLLKNRK